MREFVESSGCKLLVSSIRKYSLKKTSTPFDNEILSHLIRAMKAVMNNTVGLDAMIRMPDGVATFGLSYGIPVMKMKIIVLEILAAISLVSSQGHQRVLEAMQIYKQQTSETQRFETIVKLLRYTETEPEDPAVVLEHQVLKMLILKIWSKGGFISIHERYCQCSR